MSALATCQVFHSTPTRRLRDELLMAQSRYSGQPRTEAFGTEVTV